MIRRRQVDALIETGGGDGVVLVCSPSVGLYGFAPRVGEVLVGGSRAGRLSTLERTVELVLPAGTTGRVAERTLPTRSTAVEYGQTLLRLVPVEAAEVADGVLAATKAVAHDLAEGTLPVLSPTHGMFYRRPSPDAPAYVDVDDVVEAGTTLALVEVMKCFSAITYGGGDLPPRARIVEVRASDGVEVTADQVLFVVEPA
jgi:acetyl-CoA carboxylase biotin carboxyl carrier protein